MSAHLYIEGADSKEDQIRCRLGFRRLLEKSGFSGRMPRLSACGGRNSVFDDFMTAHAKAKAGHFVAMLIDSEDPVTDAERTWTHLKARDGWERPPGAQDEQALFMTTCMETWILADRETLKRHYGHKIQESALPPTENLEARHRRDMLDALVHATRDCSNAYQKGKRSFAIVGELNPQALELLLPSFRRFKRILNERL